MAETGKESRERQERFERELQRVINKWQVAYDDTDINNRDRIFSVDSGGVATRQRRTMRATGQSRPVFPRIVLDC